MKKIEWREDETFTEYKMRKHEGMQGMGQKTVKKREGWSDNQKRGLTNKNKGRRKQNLVKKKLQIADNRFQGADAHEENWKSGVRFEVKAGKQVEPLNKLFKKAKLQSDTNHQQIGNMSKPFVYVAMPDGTENGILCFELDNVENVCVEILKGMGYFSDY